MTGICTIDGCDLPLECRGWCNMHYKRWRRTGDPGEAAPRPRFGGKLGRQHGTFVERLERYTDRTETCWLWTGAKSNGYGQLGVDGKNRLVHRLSYELYIGPIPEGLIIDHLCRVRHCLNPDHLEVVTQRENILRGTAPTAQNARKTHCKHGHPFDEQNTYVHNNGRYCRACAAARWRAKHQQPKEPRSP